MDFKEHLKKYLTDAEIDKLCATFDGKEHKGVILNTKKISDERFLSLYPNAKKHPIVPNAFLYDQDEYQLGKSIYHDQGVFYIQDPSASLVSYFLNPKDMKHVLDMCAAPGGKSVQASLLMDEKSILYSNDLSYSRCEVLLSNIERMGLGNVVVLNKDLTRVKGLENKFDGIILDAPCSGSGMFRKMSEMKSDWTYEKVLKATHIQKDLIMHAYSLLKEGGRLVYSTCSYSFEEDEEVIQYLLSNSDAKLISLPESPLFYRSNALKEAIHLFPHMFPGEGHFIALIQKPGILVNNTNLEEYKMMRIGESKGSSKIIYNFTLPIKPIEKLIDLAIRPGLLTYKEITGKKIMSHHYSHYLGIKDSYQLNDDELKRYLHGESLTVSNNIKNCSLVSYKGNNVGAVSQTNNVLKNLYPKGLRH